MLGDGARVVVPAISDYELRRELLRSDKTDGLARLDALILELGYLPIDQVVLQNAARIWADSRKSGKPTAPDLALDGDCILAAQTRTVYKWLTHDEVVRGFQVVIATTNPRHLTRFATARNWQDISVAAFR
jgi:predicted nucleic acid-binding protein